MKAKLPVEIQVEYSHLPVEYGKTLNDHAESSTLPTRSNQASISGGLIQLATSSVIPQELHRVEHDAYVLVHTFTPELKQHDIILTKNGDVVSHIFVARYRKSSAANFVFNRLAAEVKASSESFHVPVVPRDRSRLRSRGTPVSSRVSQ
jgi:hypothetical protein